MLDRAFENYKLAEAKARTAQGRLERWQARLAGLPTPLRLPIELLCLIGIPIDEPGILTDPINHFERQTQEWKDILDQAMACRPGRYPALGLIDFGHGTLGVDFNYTYPGQENPFQGTLYTANLGKQLASSDQTELEVKDQRAPFQHVLHIPEGATVPVRVQVLGMGELDNHLDYGMWKPAVSEQSTLVTSQEIRAAVYERS